MERFYPSTAEHSRPRAASNFYSSYRQSIPNYPPPSFQEAISSVSSTSIHPTSSSSGPSALSFRSAGDRGSFSSLGHRNPRFLAPLRTTALGEHNPTPASPSSSNQRSFSPSSIPSPQSVVKRLFNSRLRPRDSEALDKWEMIPEPREYLDLLEDRPPPITPALSPPSRHHVTPYPSIPSRPEIPERRLKDRKPSSSTFRHPRIEEPFSRPSSPPSVLLEDSSSSQKQSTSRSSTPSNHHYPGRPLPLAPGPSSGMFSGQGSKTLAHSEFSETTDLDVLVSQIGDSHDGSDYETLLAFERFMEPAAPRPKKFPSSALESGEVQQTRRRVLKDRRVKLKLTLFGDSIDKCGICLSQFKAEEAATRVIRCKHAFHKACLQRWLLSHSSCPVCRRSLQD
ncbi:hypothetical protein DL96DRAFT_75672 [Flagelloscypha sp. PMI_526]|nr:hypothetical protein DL96DRAFT_75672 [Flagelloscypha sp. PMI_526]